MQGDIALAGLLLTAAEWESLDDRARTQLLAAATGRDDLWIVSEISGAIAVPRDPATPRNA
jgi:hypothetical protein